MRLYRSLVPSDASVLRSGSVLVVDASSVVTGDVIVLRGGDIVPADCEYTRAWDSDNPHVSSSPVRDTDNGDFALSSGIVVVVAVVAAAAAAASALIDGGRLTAIGGVRRVNVGGCVLAGETVEKGDFLATVTRVGKGTQLAKRIKTRSFPFSRKGEAGKILSGIRSANGKRGGKASEDDEIESEAMLGKDEV